jgi:NTP pyrophosphatase (non-canonical NTP hydrolase)
VATVGELGEAANVAKKLNRIRDDIPGNRESYDQLKEKLKRELGDAFIYLDLLCQALGFTVEEAAVESFDAKSKELGFDISFGDK